MFRWTDHLDDALEERSSWFNTISNMAKCITVNTTHSALFVSCTLLQPVAGICFRSQGVGHENRNRLDCIGMADRPYKLYQQLTDQCSVYQTNDPVFPYNDCTNSHKLHFDIGTFGENCMWAYDNYSNCVFHLLNSTVPDSSNNPAKLLIPIGIAAGVLIAATATGLCLFRSYQRRNAENGKSNELPSPIEENNKLLF